MHQREHLTRAMWTLFEPIHAVSYFAPEARQAFADIGLPRYWDGYFAGRAAPLGAVSSAPVVAVFAGFSPALAARALPAAWTAASVDQVLKARLTGAANTLRRVFADADAIATAAAALTEAADRVDTLGRPLAAANAALSRPEDPYEKLWQAATTLREHRGDGHVMAQVTEDIAGLSGIVLRCAVDLDSVTMQRARGWTEDEWNAEFDALVFRGLVSAENTLTADGIETMNRAEQLTNRLALAPWRGLADKQLRDIAVILEPIAAACLSELPEAGPAGRPVRWNPKADPEASAVPTYPPAGLTG
jgi:hypothetical protein